MKKMTKKSTPIFLLAAAAVLLLASTVGSTQAALTYYSDNYSAEVNVSNIGITLQENGSEISHRDYLKDDNWDEVQGTLFANMLAEGEELVLGKSYPAALTVTNSGAIDTYVRVILTKSWKNAEGVKDATLSPELIGLSLVTGDNGWVIDETASTPERTILYYTKILPVGESTPAMTGTLRIDPAIGTKVIETVEVTKDDQGKEWKNITFVYEYDGYTFCVEAEADAVQTHNAADAIKSAWGVRVAKAEDGSISLWPEVEEEVPTGGSESADGGEGDAAEGGETPAAGSEASEEVAE